MKPEFIILQISPKRYVVCEQYILKPKKWFHIITKRLKCYEAEKARNYFEELDCRDYPQWIHDILLEEI